MNKRSSNFSYEEIKALVTALESNQELVSNSFSKNMKNPREQKESWNVICTFVNETGHNNRTLENIKKKWYDLKHRTKAKLAKLKRLENATGGGSPTPYKLSNLEKRIGHLLGKHAVEGLGSIEDLESVDLQNVSSASIPETILNENSYDLSPQPGTSSNNRNQITDLSDPDFECQSGSPLGPRLGYVKALPPTLGQMNADDGSWAFARNKTKACPSLNSTKETEKALKTQEEILSQLKKINDCINDLKTMNARIIELSEMQLVILAKIGNVELITE